MMTFTCRSVRRLPTLDSYRIIFHSETNETSLECSLDGFQEDVHILMESVLLIVLVFCIVWVFLCFVCLRPVTCVPNVASVSGLSWKKKLIAPSVFSNNYLSCVLCALLSVSLDCSFLIVPSVFSNIYLSCVLCALCCRCL